MRYHVFRDLLVSVTKKGKHWKSQSIFVWLPTMTSPSEGVKTNLSCLVVGSVARGWLWIPWNFSIPNQASSVTPPVSKSCNDCQSVTVIPSPPMALHLLSVMLPLWVWRSWATPCPCLTPPCQGCSSTHPELLWTWPCLSVHRMWTGRRASCLCSSTLRRAAQIC